MKKMKKYNNRIIQAEKGTLTPLIYSTSGGWGPQTTRYHKRLAEKLIAITEERRRLCCPHELHAHKNQILYSSKHCTLIAIRGERGKRQASTLPVSATSFNLIPSTMEYDCY